MRRDRLPRYLHDEVELEGIEDLLVLRADAPSESDEALLGKEMCHLRVLSQVEHVAAKGLHARDEPLKRLARALQPTREHVVPPDVDAARQHAKRAVGVWDLERV